ncbi:hypothetical protein RFI_37878, partial [Reticulomyxa filosa]
MVGGMSVGCFSATINFKTKTHTHTQKPNRLFFVTMISYAFVALSKTVTLKNKLNIDLLTNSTIFLVKDIRAFLFLGKVQLLSEILHPYADCKVYKIKMQAGQNEKVEWKDEWPDSENYLDWDNNSLCEWMELINVGLFKRHQTRIRHENITGKDFEKLTNPEFLKKLGIRDIDGTCIANAAKRRMERFAKWKKDNPDPLESSWDVIDLAPMNPTYEMKVPTNDTVMQEEKENTEEFQFLKGGMTDQLHFHNNISKKKNIKAEDIEIDMSQFIKMADPLPFDTHPSPSTERHVQSISKQFLFYIHIYIY